MNRRTFLMNMAALPIATRYASAKTDTANANMISFIGGAKVNFILGMQGMPEGHVTFVSSKDKFDLIMSFSAINYHHERFTLDGQNITIDTVTPGYRSPLGEFIYRYNGIIKAGILGGILNTSWPIPDTEKNRQMLRTVIVSGKKHYQVEYTPAHRYNDMKVNIYVDTQTFRHVRTEYRVHHTQDLTTGGGDSYYTLIETFKDFRDVDGRILPHTWALEYTIDAERQEDFIGQWTINIEKWRNSYE